MTSTLVELLFCYSNNCLRTKDTFIGDHLRRIYLNCRGSRFIDRLSLYRNVDAQERLVFVVFLYGGNIPFVVSLCFASQRTPTACPCCAGSISTIGLRSFLLKVSGSSSLLSFCCTSLVSGLIIQEDARFVYWQTAQRMDFVFVQC